MQFEAWLKPPNVRETQQDQARRRLPGTCDWIWSNPTFLRWNDSSSLSAPDRVFCIYGPPGSGKSILASAIVDRLWSDKVSALFYTFSSMNASQQKSNGLIRSLLWQLVKVVIQKQSTTLLSTLMLMGQPTTSDLWTGINEIATLVSEPIYCIIDGVDESMDPISELLERVLVLLEARSNFRFILLGRQHSFHQADSIHHKIEIHPVLTKDDLDRVIEVGINRSAILNKQDVRGKVLRSLQEQSDGNFLWVKLMFVHLEKSLPLAHGIKRLDKLPRDLESIYEEFFLRLSRTLEQDELNLSQKLFAFIVVSQRPLSIAEVQHLLAADASSISKHDTQSIQDCLIPGLDQRIVDLCGDLINIVNGCLQLVHFSVKEFLVRPKKQWPSYGKRRKTIKFRVALENSHSLFASACMLYLEECLDDSPVHDQDNTLELERCHPFLRYSSTYLHTHLHQSGLPTDSTLNDLRNFLKSNRWIAWWEIMLIGHIEDESLLSHSDEGEKFLSWLGDKQEEMLAVASASLKVAFEKRAQEYGLDDPRTGRISLSLQYIGGMSVSSPAEAPAEAPGSYAVPNPSLSMDFRQIMRLVRENEPLPSQLKTNLVLGMLAYLQKAKYLTDPMKILFQKILQFGSSMPVYVLLNVGHFCQRIGRFEQAVEFYLVGLRKVEEREDQIKYRILYGLGVAYGQLGQHEKALQPLKDCLAGRTRVIGPEHKGTLRAFHATGLAHLILSQFTDSLELYKKALSGREKVLGSEHEDTLCTVFDIGVAYFQLNKYTESLEFLERALTGLEKILGPGHKKTLWTLQWIGLLYFRQHQYTESLEFLKKALRGQEMAFGPEHEETLLTHKLIWNVQNNPDYDKSAFLPRLVLE
jgi:tetratricopeptide (TPR) repeat protein